LGDDNTPYENVEKFYEFWVTDFMIDTKKHRVDLFFQFRFKSWRDFSGFDEFNLDEAESRLEKRWMDRQNQKEVICFCI
jgi:DnaJ family protein C protein 2